MWSPTMVHLTSPQFTLFSPKSVKNGPKRGAPLILTTFGEAFTLLGTPPPSQELLDSDSGTAFPFSGAIFRTSRQNFWMGGGPKRVNISPNRVTHRFGRHTPRRPSNGPLVSPVKARRRLSGDRVAKIAVTVLWGVKCAPL